MASPATGIALATLAAAAILMLCAIHAQSEPVTTDPYKCVDRDPAVKCCSRRKAVEIVDFVPGPQPVQLRVRQPAHALTPEAARKYEKAVALMRALPEDHPWNFVQQSNVHCAYCSGGHLQLGTNMTIEIHGSWHFFTWHRAYLFFYERILGKLIDDPSFALPFWNWDDPAGMSIPLIYRDNSSALFNPTRYYSALNFTDLGECHLGSPPAPLSKQQQCNLQIMHTQFLAASNSTSVFFGSPLRAGGLSFPGGGPIESSPHSPVHMSTGFDMSRIARSGLDPLFYIHHSNIDRLWAIWDGIPGNGSKVITDPDFLDASFLFWDENMKMVRIKVRDIMDIKKLGYVYQDVPLQWMNIETVVEVGKGGGMQARSEAAAEVIFPVDLSSEARVRVARKPAADRETLVVSGIEMDGRDYVSFDVYLSRARAGGAGRRVKAGCFIHMGRTSDKKISVVTKLQVEIRELINEIGAAGDDLILVTLAPKEGGEKVAVGGVSVM